MTQQVSRGSGRIPEKVWTKMGKNATWGSGISLKSTSLDKTQLCRQGEPHAVQGMRARRWISSMLFSLGRLGAATKAAVLDVYLAASGLVENVKSAHQAMEFNTLGDVSLSKKSGALLNFMITQYSSAPTFSRSTRFAEKRTQVPDVDRAGCG